MTTEKRVVKNFGVISACIHLNKGEMRKNLAQLKPPEARMELAVDLALLELKEKAAEAGANAVIAIQFQIWADEGTPSNCLVATGTAVFLTED